MHSVEDARAAVLATAALLEDESVALEHALGRVLREEVRAGQDVPSTPTSAMDGFAVAAEAALELRIGAESAAGAPRTAPLRPGEAAPISTGALLPPGATAVVPIEDCTLDGERLLLAAAPRPGQFVRAPASELVAGELLLPPGQTITAAGVALLAGQGRTAVKVSRRPRVAIVSMGRELVRRGAPLTAGQLYDANGPALAALCHEAGAVATVTPIVADEEGALAEQLTKLDADVIVSSGGASVGPHDHLRGAIARAGGEVLLWRVAMKPGKPLVLARLAGRPLLGLPGNPVSAMVSFLLFVGPLLRRMVGAEPTFDASPVHVRLAAPLAVVSDRRTFLRARVYSVGVELRAELATRQGSAALVSMLGANALVEVPAGEQRYQAGAILPAWLYDRLDVRLDAAP